MLPATNNQGLVIRHHCMKMSLCNPYLRGQMPDLAVLDVDILAYCFAYC